MLNNKVRTQAFWNELFNAHDLDRVEDFIAPGSVNHNARSGTPDGPDGAREVFTRLWRGSSDMHFELQAMVAEDDKVVCIGMMSGTHDGPFRGMPATYRRTSARHVHVLTFDDAGLIAEHVAVRDDLTLLRQLGALADDLPRMRQSTAQRSNRASTHEPPALGSSCRSCPRRDPTPRNRPRMLGGQKRSDGTRIRDCHPPEIEIRP